MSFQEKMVQSRPWTMVPVALFLVQTGPFALYTISLNFCTWLFGPEKPGLDHGHSDQESQIWTMVNWTKKSHVWTMVQTGPLFFQGTIWTIFTGPAISPEFGLKREELVLLNRFCISLGMCACF
jgi:hypothetical protein